MTVRGLWRSSVNGRKRNSPPTLHGLEAEIGEKISVPEAHPDAAECLCFCVNAFEEETAQDSRPVAFVDKLKSLSKTENRE